MKRIYLLMLVVFLLAMIFVKGVSAGVVPTEAEYFFTEIKGSTGARRVVPITITNTGPNAITINSASFVGTNAGEFSFSTAPTFPFNLATNDSVTYNVVFYPPSSTDYSPPYPPSAFRTATLRVNSTDSSTPVLNVALYGLSTNGTGGNNEPRLQMVTDILGYSINVGSTAYLVRPLPEDFTPIGDEVVAQLFEKAGSGPVTMTSVMRFSPTGVINYGYYFPDGTSVPTLNEVNRIGTANAIGNSLNHQTLMPATLTTNRTFDPGAQPFGLYALSPAFPSYTQDELNGREGQRIRAARTFLVRQRNGAARPNTYLVVFEDSTNGDFQDFGFLVTNVRPVNPAPTPTPTNTQVPSGVCVYQEQGGSVVIEAENYDTNTAGLGDSWQVVTNVAGYAGSGAMQSLPNDGTNAQSQTTGPRLTYPISFSTPGTYYVALRGYGASASDDTVFIGVDGTQVSQLGLGSSSLKWNEKFGSTDVSVNIPAAGTYTFMLWMREDGSIIDRIWLTTNVNAVANGNTTQNPAQSPCVGGGPTVTPTAVITATSTPSNTPTNVPSNTPTATATTTQVPSGGCVYQEQGGSVVMEAENYDTNTAALGDSWTLVTNVAGYAGSGAMQTLPNDGTNTQNQTNGPRLTYRIAFSSPGTYYVALRGYGPSANDDTVFIGLDGAQISQLGLGSTSLKWNEKFGSADVSVNVPAAGTYTFMLWMREDGAIIDRLWLTTNVNAVANGNTAQNPPNSAVDCSGSGNVSASQTVIIVPTQAAATSTFTATSVPPTVTETPLPTLTSTPLPTVTEMPLPTATETPLPTATNTDLPTATLTETPAS